MAANTLSVYVPSPLYERVKQAQADGKINVKSVCNDALERELAALEAPQPSGLVVPGIQDSATPRGTGDLTQEVDLSRLADAAELAQQASQIDYQFSYSNNMTEAQAFLDHIATQGAWPISHHVDIATGGIGFLVAWPKVLTDPDQ